MTGFPDWQRGQAGASEALFSGGSTSGSGFDSGAFNMSSWPFLTITQSAVNNDIYWLAEVSWLYGNDTVNVLSKGVYTFTSSGPNTITVPALSPWCRVQFTALQTQGAQSVSFYGYGVTQAGRQAASTYDARPLLADTGSVAAGATVSLTAASIAPGPATWAVRLNDSTTWQAHLSYWSHITLGWVVMIEADGSTIGTTMITQVTLPPAPARIDLTNNATVSRDYQMSLTV